MKNFMDEDFLLQTETAKKLFNSYAKDLPIIDYHCHIIPKEIAEDKRYENITQVWLYGDHYKWRAMRCCGVAEEFITGNASDFDKFKAYAEVMPMLIGNPLYHWTHLELQRYFDVKTPLTGDTAKEIYDLCNKKLKTMSARSIIKASGVQVICTTDDPDDSLEFHQKIAADSSFDCKVLPTFRPDRLLKNEANMPKADLLAHIEKRLDFFMENGCKLADHGLSTFSDDYSLLFEVAKLYKERGITMQLHFGALRNANSNMFNKIGADTGFDCIGDSKNADGLMAFLDGLDKLNKLPKTIIYSLNPNDNAMLDALSSCYRNVKHGAAWWFNDTKAGMEAHIKQLADITPLGEFLGMLTDSRSFLSYTRHEYFRRIYCNMLGNMVENGEYPNDEKSLEALVKRISYINARDFLGL